MQVTEFHFPLILLWDINFSYSFHIVVFSSQEIHSAEHHSTEHCHLMECQNHQHVARPIGKTVPHSYLKKEHQAPFLLQVLLSHPRMTQRTKEDLPHDDKEFYMENSFHNAIVYDDTPKNKERLVRKC